MFINYLYLIAYLTYCKNYAFRKKITWMNEWKAVLSRVGKAAGDSNTTFEWHLQIPPHTCMENKATVLAAYPRLGEKQKPFHH